MKKTLIICLVVIILIVAGGVGYFIWRQSNQDNFDSGSYVGEQTTLIHKDFRAIMKADWEEDEIADSMFMYLPPGTVEDDVDAEVITIVTSYLGEDYSYSLDDLLEQGLAGSAGIMSDFNLISETEKNNPYFTGKLIKYTGTSEGILRDNLQFFGIANNTLYVVTYSCPAESCTSQPVFDYLVETFEPVVVEK